MSVVAPAGHGKTTLMSQWMTELRQRGCACAWLTLDDSDNDPARFLRHLIATLQRSGVHAGDATLAHLSDTLASQFRSVTESLSVDLASNPHRLMLMLDDVHVLHEETVLDIVDWLLHYAPGQIQITLGSRDELPWRLGSLRVRGLLHEVDHRQLPFNEQEARSLCRQHVRLHDEDLRLLLHRTEGNPTALELACVVLHTQATDPAQVSRLIEQFANHDGHAIPYLCEQLLRHQPPAWRQLVMRLSMLTRFDTRLAREVSEPHDSGHLLAQLQGIRAFLIPSDGSGQSCRLHELPRACFKAHFLSQAPQDARAVLIKAAQWCWNEGATEDAMGYALEARAWELATPWLAHSMHDIAQKRGELQLALQWMNSIPADWLDRYPTIRIDYAFALSFFPQKPEVATQLRALQAIRQRLAHSPEPDVRTIDQIDCAMSFQRVLSLGLTDQGHPARHAAKEWLARWPHAPALQRGIVGNVLCFGYKTTGELEEGLQMAHVARNWLEQDQAWYGLAWNASLEAVLHLKRGHYPQARSACTRGLQTIEQHLGGHRTHASVHHVLLAALDYEADDLANAQRHMDQSLDSLAQYGGADILIVGWLTRARLRFAQHDLEGGLSVLHEGRTLALRRGLPRVLLALVAETCVQLCRAGRLTEARTLARSQGLDSFPQDTTEQPDNPYQDLLGGIRADRAQRVAARLLLPIKPDQVMQHLTMPIARCAQRGLVHQHIELLIVQAMAAQACHRKLEARQAMSQALELAAQQDHVRIFKDDAAALGPLLTACKLDTLPPAAQTLWHRLTQPTRTESASHSLDGADQADHPEALAAHGLTRRELGILQRLASGLSIKEIAEAIFISEGTLKWHLHNIYGKLGSKNRSGALAQARAIGAIR
ncbi:MAG: hypothetical protein HYX44_03540 [Aquabacterium sp.]|nr:hypothetical protein [Aquabacterium sp.]